MNIKRANVSGKGVQIHKGSLRWSYGRGYSYTDRLKGYYRDLEPIFPVLTRTYDEIELTQDSDSNQWTILATYGGDEDPIHTFAIRKTVLQQSVFYNSRIISGVGGVRNLSVVRGYWEKILATRGITANEEAWIEATGEISSSSSFSSVQATFALDFLDELNKDVTSFITTSYLFAHTITLSRRDVETPANYNDVDKIFTTAQMLADEEYPSTNQSPPDKQWLKQAPDVELTLGQRKIIHTEYIGADSWSTLQYANKT